MDTYVFRYETEIKTTLKQAWAFFSNPENMEIIQKVPKVRVETEEKNFTVSMNMVFFKLKWEGSVVEEKSPAYFIDRASNLPFPLSFWEHKHQLQEKGNHILMIDEVSFRSKVPSAIVAKGLKMMFKAREKQCKAYFSSTADVG